jgi:hypothetical protein
MREKINAYRDLVGKPEAKRLFCSPGVEEFITFI